MSLLFTVTARFDRKGFLQVKNCLKTQKGLFTIAL
jgi:hypothetical protein